MTTINHQQAAIQAGAKALAEHQIGEDWGDDGEMCRACFTDIFDTANRTRHPKETHHVDS